MRRNETPRFQIYMSLHSNQYSTKEDSILKLDEDSRETDDALGSFRYLVL